MDRQQLEKLKASGKEQLERLIQLVSLERFNVFEDNRRKLNQSLKLLGREDLIDKTLLDERVHSRHSRELYKLFLAELKRLKKRNLDERENIRFVTIIHAVTSLDDDSGVVEALRLKELLAGVIKKQDYSFIGAIEGEVINIEKLRIFAKENPDYDTKKLDLCEMLGDHSTEKTLLLVHLHGCLFSRTGRGFEEMEKRFRDIWAYGYQVESKKTYAQNKTEKNLQNIARYITKGGQQWQNDKSSLKFKMGFTNEDIETQMAYQTRQREQEFYDLENDIFEKNSIEDTMSLNAIEITALASFIDKLMNLDAEKTGYQVILK